LQAFGQANVDHRSISRVHLILKVGGVSTHLFNQDSKLSENDGLKDSGKDHDGESEQDLIIGPRHNFYKREVNSGSIEQHQVLVNRISIINFCKGFIISEAIESEIYSRPPHLLLLEYKPEKAGCRVPVNNDFQDHKKNIDVGLDINTDSTIPNLKI
jgi:hypothetical protein